MAYLALYRRFRPEGFDKLIGQDAIVRTLKNQIKTDKVGHAYLFTGARGTGKTSCAKIFAKAINCLEPKDGSPCNECKACKSLSQPGNIDILEIDAASNNKVEEIRELREKIQYPPISCRYKVYIVDEVHMLTDSAFNALLKTLEEPPSHAVFILATTEAHKMPATILSRCMRFDFRLISIEKIADNIKKIYKELNKPYEEEAVELIAKAGEGSVRDALSIADICLSYSDGKLTYADVLSVLGASNRDKIYELSEALVTGDGGAVLKLIDGIISSGKSVGVLAKDILSDLRNMLISLTCNDGQKILAMPDGDYKTLKARAEKADEKRLSRIIEIFSGLETQLRYSVSPRIILESGAMKAVRPQNDYNIDSLLYRVNALEDKLKSGSFFSREKEEEEPVAEVAPKKTEEPETETPGKGKAFGLLIKQLRSDNKIMLWAACSEQKAFEEEGRLIIAASDESSYKVLSKPENLETLKSELKKVCSHELAVNPPAKAKDTFKEDVEELKRSFGEDIVKIKNS